MPINSHELASPISLALLSPILAALGAVDTAKLRPVGPLPSPCFKIVDVRAVVCATSIYSIAMFRAEMISVAATTGMDVVMLRHGHIPRHWTT